MDEIFTMGEPVLPDDDSAYETTDNPARRIGLTGWEHVGDAMIAGYQSERLPPVVINSAEDAEKWSHHCLVGARGSAFTMLKNASRAKPTSAFAKKSPKAATLIRNLSRISSNVLQQAGRNEADRLDKPNILCCIYGTSLAPAGTLAFSIVPGGSNSYYRVLGFICDDTQAGVFGFSSLRIGGQEHVQMTQSTPTAPVTQACSWNIFALRESRQRTNIQPWSGQFFDGTIPIAGTIVNMTVAATADAVTLAPRITVLAQSNPCSFNYEKVKEGAARWWSSFGKGMGTFSGLR